MIPCTVKADFRPERGGFLPKTREQFGLFGAPVSGEIAGCDIVLAGLRAELDSSARAGCRDGISLFRMYQQNDICSDQRWNVQVKDCGDCCADVELLLRQICAVGAVPYVIGGDEGTSYSQLRACSERYGKLAVLHFGASLSEALLRVAEEGLCCGEASVDCGARNGYAELGTAMQRNRILCLNAEELEQQPVQTLSAALRRRTAGLPVMVLFDVNFLDPVFVPSAARPYAGGFSTEETVMFLEQPIPPLPVRAIAAYGLLGQEDPCGLSLGNTAAALTALYHAVAKRITVEKGEC